MSQAIRSLLWLVLILAVGALVIYWDQGRRLQNLDGASLGTPEVEQGNLWKNFK